MYHKVGNEERDHLTRGVRTSDRQGEGWGREHLLGRASSTIHCQRLTSKTRSLTSVTKRIQSLRSVVASSFLYDKKGQSLRLRLRTLVNWTQCFAHIPSRSQTSVRLTGVSAPRDMTKSLVNVGRVMTTSGWHRTPAGRNPTSTRRFRATFRMMVLRTLLRKLPFTFTLRKFPSDTVLLSSNHCS